MTDEIFAVEVVLNFSSLGVLCVHNPRLHKAKANHTFTVSLLLYYPELDGIVSENVCKA